MEEFEQFKMLFEPDLVKAIEDQATPVSIPEGDIILDVGQVIRSVPIILSGLVKVSRVEDDGKELLLYYVNPNESCAMTFTCCMQQHVSEIRATAEEPVTMLAIPIHLMDEWLVKFPTWKNFVMKTIRNRFHEMIQVIDQVAFKKLDVRLVSYLKEKSRVTGSTLINLSHEQIASELATTRVVISRLLKALENDGKVLLYRNQIKLLRDL